MPPRGRVYLGLKSSLRTRHHRLQRGVGQERCRQVGEHITVNRGHPHLHIDAGGADRADGLEPVGSADQGVRQGQGVDADVE
jgi:hypothetical protein